MLNQVLSYLNCFCLFVRLFQSGIWKCMNMVLEGGPDEHQQDKVGSIE